MFSGNLCEMNNLYYSLNMPKMEPHIYSSLCEHTADNIKKYVGITLSTLRHL